MVQWVKGGTDVKEGKENFVAPVHSAIEIRPVFLSDICWWQQSAVPAIVSCMKWPALLFRVFMWQVSGAVLYYLFCVVSRLLLMIGSQKSLISTKVISGFTSAPDLTEVESEETIGWQLSLPTWLCPCCLVLLFCDYQLVRKPSYVSLFSFQAFSCNLYSIYHCFGSGFPHSLRCSWITSLWISS